MISQNNITVVIPHLGSTKEQEFSLDECSKSLWETVPQARIIVVKNGLVNCTNHSYHVHIKEQGQCRAVNAAVATINTPWVFVTNDDMIYAPGWFEKLTDPISTQLCVSPKLIEPRGGAPTFEVYFCGGAGGDFNKTKWLEFAKNYKGQGIRTGFNLPFLIKKELWDLISGYDTQYDPWGSNSDSDLEYKIRLAGVQPYQNTNSVVYHFSTVSGTSHPDNRPYWQRNWEYFISKWGFERASGNQIWEANFDIPEDKLKYGPFWKGFYNKHT